MKSLYLGEPPTEESDEEKFNMTGELGLLFADGNTNGTSFTGKLDAKQNLSQWHNTYSVNFLYKENNREVDGVRQDVTSAQKLFISVQSDYKLNRPGKRLFMYGEYEDDRFNQYQYQAALAVGWSAKVWDTERSEFRYSIGPGYAISKLNEGSDGQDQMGMIVRAAIEFEQKLGSYATFRQFLSTEADDVYARSVSETSLATKINGAMAMKLSLNMIHNKSPDNVGRSLDTQTAVTLVYQFF